MASAFFITNMKMGIKPSIPSFGGRYLYCRMFDFHGQIKANGGIWAEVVVGTGYAVVKVRAPEAGLDFLAAQSGIMRVPLNLLDDSLGTLTPQQRQTLRDVVEAMGYSVEEINAALPDWRVITLRQLFHFIFSRRRRARFDEISQDFIFDGSVATCAKTIEQLDVEIVD